MTGNGVWQEHSTAGYKISGSACGLSGDGVGGRGRGRVLGKMQSSSMQQFVFVYEEVRRLEAGWQAGRSRWAGLGGCEGGSADVTHAN